MKFRRRPFRLFKKKRYFRRKRRYGRRLRISRPLTTNVLYTKLTQLRIASGTLGAQGYMDLGFDIGDLTNMNGLRPFWERVRLHKIAVKIVPKFNVIGLTNPPQATAAVPDIGDHGLIRTPSTFFPTTPTFSWNAFSSLDKVKIRRGTQILKAMCIPNIVTYATSFTTAGVATPAIASVLYKPWISSTAENVHFFTWIYSRQVGSNANSVEYNVYVTAYCEFRDRVSPGFNA